MCISVEFCVIVGGVLMWTIMEPLGRGDTYMTSGDEIFLWISHSHARYRYGVDCVFLVGANAYITTSGG